MDDAAAFVPLVAPRAPPSLHQQRAIIPSPARRLVVCAPAGPHRRIHHHHHRHHLPLVRQPHGHRLQAAGRRHSTHSSLQHQHREEEDEEDRHIADHHGANDAHGDGQQQQQHHHHLHWPRRAAAADAAVVAALDPAAARPARWARIAIGVVGVTLGTVLPAFRVGGAGNTGFPVARPAPSVAAETFAVPVYKVDGSLPLPALGIKQDEYVSHRELARRKTTQYSEAEEEIMELEEDQFENQWFHDLQVMWAALASVGGIMVLYKGGVLWEKWIQEQERKDMEEEIELTGTFIDPRAVRKDEDADDKGKKKSKNNNTNGGTDDKNPGTNPSTPSNGGGGPSGSGGGPDANPPDADLPTGGIDALERLFGKS